MFLVGTGCSFERGCVKTAGYNVARHDPAVNEEDAVAKERGEILAYLNDENPLLAIGLVPRW